MDKTKFNYYTTLGTFRKCCQSSYFDCYMHVYDCGICKYSLKSELSIYEIIQILGILVFDKTPIKELLTEIKVNQNVKELCNLFSNQF